VEVHSIIAKALTDHGVDTMFGLIGDGNLFMVDDYVRQRGMTFIPVATEASALPMANGYSSISGKVGVATVTHGPGFTNTVTSLVEGVRGQAPLLLVTGDTAVVDRDNFQNVVQRRFADAAGAGFEQLRAPHTAAEDVAVALRRAVLERRPIVLNVPVEFQWEDADYVPVAAPPVPQLQRPDPDALDRALGIIASARRPLVLAGRGAASPRARDSLLRLAERIGAPVATTLRGRNLFAGDPFNLGVFGTLASPVATDVILETDCVIAFGAGLNKYTTASGSLVNGKAVVHCDLDPVVLGSFTRVDAPIVGDAATVADSMVELLDVGDTAPSPFRSDQLAARISASPTLEFDDRSTSHTIDVRTALARLDEVVPRNRIVVSDVGRFLLHEWTLVNPPNPWSYVQPVNFGSVGLGMANAIGAAHADPSRPVLLITGDGGFALGGLVEFSSAVRDRIDLIVVVCNDGSYGAEHALFRARGMDPSLSLLSLPDLAPIAKALGGDGVTVTNLDDLQSASNAIENRDRPLLIDVKLDPDHIPWPGL
jgi:thiamine pyrophosphate-dependent acetolactate synthase large subunit-like protein